MRHAEFLPQRIFCGLMSLATQAELFETLPDGSESCAWLNRLLVRLLLEYRGSHIERRVREKINARLALVRSTLVTNIVVDDVAIGGAAPLLQPIRLLPPKQPYEIRAEFDVVYDG